jgi:hypothetical protein
MAIKGMVNFGWYMNRNSREIKVEKQYYLLGCNTM